MKTAYASISIRAVPSPSERHPRNNRPRRGSPHVLAFAAAAIAIALSPVAKAAPLPKLKESAVAAVEARAKLAQVANDMLFSFGELGFEEVETAKYLTSQLKKHGFQVDHGVAGIPTAWTARWTYGVGGPVIALGSDVDAVPGASQVPGLPWHQPLVEGAPGHGEGHNSGHAVILVAALAAKEIMQREKIPGTLLLWPGVAEEIVAGKAFMVRDGVFRDVDAVLFTHVDDELATSWGRTAGTGLVSVEYEFAGSSAHSASAPWRGKSALDAVTLMNLGWELRREHLRPEQRSHYVIPRGGAQPNVVPSSASVWYFFREQDFGRIRQNFAIGNQIAKAAASMTDTTVSWRLLGTAAPRHFNRPLAEAAFANIQVVGQPKWSEEEQAFAKAVQRAVQAEKVEGLRVSVPELKPPVDEPKSGGSDDIGDVSWTVPTITINYPANIPNLPGHHWSDAIAMATPIAHKGVLAGAKVVAMTTLDLLTKHELRAAARDYFDNVQNKNERYQPMLTAADKPAIRFNSDVMSRFRPAMRKFYYDPAKHATYLDQLGVKFPTFERPAK